MKNYQRAKEYQKKLYNALNAEWREDLFNHRWISTIYGNQWDRLDEMGLVEYDFCALCGDNNLQSGYCRIPSFSMRRVQIPICDECWQERGYDAVMVAREKFRKSRNRGCIIASIVLIIILWLLI